MNLSLSVRRWRDATSGQRPKFPAPVLVPQVVVGVHSSCCIQGSRVLECEFQQMHPLTLGFYVKLVQVPPVPVVVVAITCAHAHVAAASGQHSGKAHCIHS